MTVHRGDPIAWFTARATTNDKFQFNSLGGSRALLVFLGTLGSPHLARFWADLSDISPRFDALDVVTAGVSHDRSDLAERRHEPAAPLRLVFWDFDLAIAKRFGLAAPPNDRDGSRPPRPWALLLDRGQRVLATMALADIGWDVEALYRMVLDACRSEDAWEQGMVAPVLHVPNVIEPDLCAEMIALWHTGNEDSGYMKTNDAGKLVGYIDYRRKRRRDHFVANRSPLYDRLNATFARRLIPPIRHAYNYRATRVERFCIAGYDSAEGGYFRRHRDRGEDGHRAFAVTINLNAEGHEGGALWFPEFGRRQYRPRSGDAVIFSGALMHEALPVTAGIRFALLSFVYGEDEAKLRQDYRRRHGSEHETVRVTPMTSG